MSGIKILSFTAVLIVFIVICCFKEAKAERGRKCEGIEYFRQLEAKKKDIVKTKERKNKEPLCKDKLFTE
jgi:hypothetical protein